jgi:hypothetical protein
MSVESLIFFLLLNLVNVQVHDCQDVMQQLHCDGDVYRPPFVPRWKHDSTASMPTEFDLHAESVYSSENAAVLMNETAIKLELYQFNMSSRSIQHVDMLNMTRMQRLQHIQQVPFDNFGISMGEMGWRLKDEGIHRNFQTLFFENSDFVSRFFSVDTFLCSEQQVH